jgi:hypothetical protein
MRTNRLIPALAITVAAVVSTMSKAGDDLVIPLKFIPTVNPEKVAPALKEGVSNKPVAIAIQDIRQVKTKDLIGDGTGMGDDTFRIRFAGHLPSYLKTTVNDRFGAWGFQTDETSDLVLTIKVTRFHVAERHAFYGSIFSAEVQLPWTLSDRAGNTFASGTALGTGKTKGRWRNPINCEEVLADALQQAASIAAGDAALQDAWLAATPRPAPVQLATKAPAAPSNKYRVGSAIVPNRDEPRQAKPTGIAKTPSQLLADVTKLHRQQLGTDVMVDYVSKQHLATAFSANDLVAWKKAGIPDLVMQAALQRAP